MAFDLARPAAAHSLPAKAIRRCLIKWFKHMANARDDDFIEWLEETYGFEGYGRWWRILEIIASAMDKNRNDPSATHTRKKWQELLGGKWSILISFLLAIQLKEKLVIELSENILKISCPNILKMRDNYTKDLQASGKQLAMNLLLEAEADKEKDINLLTSLPVDNLVKAGDNKPPIPVPKIPAQEKSFNDDDLVAAAAACCSVLQRRNLTPDDERVLRSWLKNYDFPNMVLPIIAESAQRYAMKNHKPPATLQYFVDRVNEKTMSH